jgi:hypothetical protein
VSYDLNVFINCPFDGDYERLFRALVFAVQACGYRPRSALEIDDGSEVRLDKIMRIIGECRYGRHDLSRTELDEAGNLPRFNMALELGLFLGAKYFGGGVQKEKACIIFDRERYRYQRFCSDIAGQDIRAHNGSELDIIRAVRDALATWRPIEYLPSGSILHEHYRRFLRQLPIYARRNRLRVDELTFNDFTRAVADWLLATGGSPPAG